MGVWRNVMVIKQVRANIQKLNNLRDKSKIAFYNTEKKYKTDVLIMAANRRAKQKAVSIGGKRSSFSKNDILKLKLQSIINKKQVYPYPNFISGKVSLPNISLIYQLNTQSALKKSSFIYSNIPVKKI